MHDGTEDEVLGLLCRRQFVEGDHAGMDLVLNVFVGAILPAVRVLLFEPRVVAGLRAGARVAQVQVHAGDGALLLPLGGVFPGYLGQVALALTVGAVHLMAYAGDGFVQGFGHAVSFLAWQIW